MRDQINFFVFWVFGTVLFVLTGCNKHSAASASFVPPTGASAESARFTNYTYELIGVYPHDTNAFTEGLVFLGGDLLESTGADGQSTLRKVDLRTGQVVKQVELLGPYFAEGLAVLGSNVFQLTYLDHKGFVYELGSLQLKKEFAFACEGWGLATDGRWLMMSDGTDQIRFLDPLTFKLKRTISVRLQGQRVNWLNELEYVKGEIFANVWRTDFVVRIDPATGKVLGAIDFTGLLTANDRSIHTDVLNGIAYDAAGDRLFVTGKRWPKLFEVRLKVK